MKNKIILMMLTISTLSLAAKTAAVDASVNLIKTIEIEALATSTTKTITNTFTGLVEFPKIDLITKGNPGTAILLTTNQTVELTGSGGDKVPISATFDAGSVSTDGTNAKTIQIIDPNGSIANTLNLSTTLATTLAADIYTGTANITAAYN